MCKAPYLVLPCGHLARREIEFCSSHKAKAAERCQYQTLELRRPPIDEHESYRLEGEKCIGCGHCFRSSNEFAIAQPAREYQPSNEIVVGESASERPSFRLKKPTFLRGFRRRRVFSKDSDSRRSGYDSRSFSADEPQQALASKGVITKEEQRLVTLQIAFDEDDLDLQDIMDMAVARVACCIALEGAQDIQDGRVDRIWELLADHFGAGGESLTVSVRISKPSVLSQANTSQADVMPTSDQAAKDNQRVGGFITESEEPPATLASRNMRENLRNRSSTSLSRSVLSRITEDVHDDGDRQGSHTEAPLSSTKSKTPNNNPNLEVPRKRLQNGSSDATSVGTLPGSPGATNFSLNESKSNQVSQDTRNEREEAVNEDEKTTLLPRPKNVHQLKDRTWTRRRFKVLVGKLIRQVSQEHPGGNTEDKAQFPDPADVNIKSKKSWRDIAIFNSLRRSKFRSDAVIHHSVTSQGLRKSVSTFASHHDMRSLNFRLKPRSRSVVVEHRLRSKASESGWRPKQYPRNYLPHDWALGKPNLREGSSRSRHQISPGDVIGTAGGENWGYPVSTSSASTVSPETSHQNANHHNMMTLGHHNTIAHEDGSSRDVVSTRASIETYYPSTRSVNRTANGAGSSIEDLDERGRSTSPARRPRPRIVSPPVVPHHRVPFQPLRSTTNDNWPLAKLPSIRFDRQRKSTDASYDIDRSDKLNFPAYHRASGELSPQTTKSHGNGDRSGGE